MLFHCLNGICAFSLPGRFLRQKPNRHWRGREEAQKPSMTPGYFRGSNSSNFVAFCPAAVVKVFAQAQECSARSALSDHTCRFSICQWSTSKKLPHISRPWITATSESPSSPLIAASWPDVQNSQSRSSMLAARSVCLCPSTSANFSLRDCWIKVGSPGTELEFAL